MGSPLFEFAKRRLQQFAANQFKKTALSKLLGQAQSLASQGRLNRQEARRIEGKLAGYTSKKTAQELLRLLGAEDLVQEADQRGKGSEYVGKVLDVLGPLGSLIRSLSNPTRTGGQRVGASREIQAATALLRSIGKLTVDPLDLTGLSNRDQAALAEALRNLGWKFTAPGAGPKKEPKSRPSRRTTTDVDAGVYSDSRGSFSTRIRKDDPIFTGEMIPVQSSNVHSIGFRIDDPEPMRARTGTLLIRFLGTGSGGSRSGLGPMYEYDEVPITVFQAFRKAASKGKFVWDEVRVRGTVSGHQYPYRLADIVNGYVPRMAGIKRGMLGEYYLQRKFRDANGVLHSSSLPERHVRGPKGALEGPGIDRLNIHPNRGEPNRGAPNRGRPNRGR